MSAMEISSNYGVYEKRFENVYNKFNANLASSIDIGASFAVYSNGKLLIDLAGGFKNKDKTELWAPTTTVCVHSTGKGIIAMCLAILIEKDKLNLDSKVSEYWPEFGASNKTDIKVRTLLSHQAGLYAWKEKMTESDFLNWNYCTELLAAQETLHIPGTKICYHAKSIGFLVGELIKRISGKSVGEFLKEELVNPLNVSCTIGTPISYHSEIAELISSPDLNAAFNDRDKIDKYTMSAFLNPGNRTRTANTEEFKVAEIPALNCHSNSVSLAKLYDYFFNSGLVSNSTLESITSIEIKGDDQVMKRPMQWSPVGFSIGGGKLFGTSSRSFGHTGWGGSMAFTDPENNLSIAYTMNLLTGSMLGDNRALELVAETYKSL
jgi:CubicO group peptidase (beta-lactamase class C family)